MLRATQTTFALIILFGLVGLFSLCFGSFAAMKMSKIGPMSNCALAHAATLCPVTVTQHLQFWQQVIVTTSPSAMLLVLMLVAVVLSIKRVIDPLQTAVFRLRYSAWQLLTEPTLLFGDYLRQAFSQGILHPKSY